MRLQRPPRHQIRRRPFPRLDADVHRPGGVDSRLHGRRVAVPIAKTSSTAMPSLFRVLQITLADGGTVNAAPGHPTAELRPLLDYRMGDILDNGRIVSIQTVEYLDGALVAEFPNALKLSFQLPIFNALGLIWYNAHKVYGFYLIHNKM